MKWLQELLGEPAGSTTAAENPAGVPASGGETPVEGEAVQLAAGVAAAASEPAGEGPVVSAGPQEGVGADVAGDATSAESSGPPAQGRGGSISAAAVDSALEARLVELVQSHQELKSLFESRIHSDEVQGKAVERLSDELRDYKANFIRQQMLPLLKELIFCYDFVMGEAQRLRNPEPTGNADPLKSLDMLGQMLMDVLFKYDVEPYRGEGEQFDPKVQQCSRTVPTEIEEQDKKIAGAGATGFQSPAGIIRREQVMVYKFRPAAK